GSSINEVVAHVKATIDDPDISISVHQGNEPSKVSSSTSKNYSIIETTIRETIKDVIISPGLMLAGSDSKHYESMSEDNYRFIPMRLGPNDLSRIHGTNERIMVKNYKEVIQFYSRLMENAGR
ncbi:MAG: M20/M25/M40 family metallo-hydrolase, partial [Sneathiella sp.]|nr:M20/M25/M40 family metallo-hydrolase [Sneathiella sp.]